jgi:hypothetical protein
MKKHTYFCPAEDSSCPYFNKRFGTCGLEDPLSDCDEFYLAEEVEEWIHEEEQDDFPSGEEEEEPDDFPD